MAGKSSPSRARLPRNCGLIQNRKAYTLQQIKGSRFFVWLPFIIRYRARALGITLLQVSYLLAMVQTILHCFLRCFALAFLHEVRLIAFLHLSVGFAVSRQESC